MAEYRRNLEHGKKGHEGKVRVGEWIESSFSEDLQRTLELDPERSTLVLAVASRCGTNVSEYMQAKKMFCKRGCSRRHSRTWSWARKTTKNRFASVAGDFQGFNNRSQKDLKYSLASGTSRFSALPGVLATSSTSLCDCNI